MILRIMVEDEEDMQRTTVMTAKPVKNVQEAYSTLFALACDWEFNESVEAELCDDGGRTICKFYPAAMVTATTKAEHDANIVLTPIR